MSGCTVLIADDNQIFRAGVRMLISRAEDFEVVGEASDGIEAVALAIALRPDVVVMDIAMPKLNGLEATRRIAAESPSTRIVILTGSDAPEMHYAADALGAVGFISKSAVVPELLAAMRTAVAVSR